jgi:hypothetical protein
VHGVAPPSRPHGATRPRGTGAEIGVKSSAPGGSAQYTYTVTVVTPFHEPQPQTAKKSGR